MSKIKLPSRMNSKIKKVKPPKPAKPTTAWRLMRPSLAEYRHNWKPYVKILAIIAVPSDLVALSSTLSADALTSAYISLAALIMNVTLIWSIVRREKTGKVPGVASAYYEGSEALVRFILVSAVLVLMLTPAAFGAALYGTGLAAASATGAAGSVQLIVGLISLVVSLPSFFLLVRYGLAPFAIVQDGLRPSEALRLSRRYTTGRFWPVAGRFVMLGLFMLVVSIPVSLVSFGLSLLHASNIAAVVFEVGTTLIALPLANIYIFRLYRNLADTVTPTDSSVTETVSKDKKLAETAA